MQTFVDVGSRILIIFSAISMAIVKKKKKKLKSGDPLIFRLNIALARIFWSVKLSI